MQTLNLSNLPANVQKGWDPDQGWWRYSLVWLLLIASILVRKYTIKSFWVKKYIIEYILVSIYVVISVLEFI